MINKKFKIVKVEGDKAYVDYKTKSTDEYDSLFHSKDKVIQMTNDVFLTKIINKKTLSKFFMKDFIENKIIPDNYEIPIDLDSVHSLNQSSIIHCKNSIEFNQYERMLKEYIDEKFNMTISDFLRVNEGSYIEKYEKELLILFAKLIRVRIVSILEALIEDCSSTFSDAFFEELMAKSEIAFVEHNKKGYYTESYSKGDLVLNWETNYGYGYWNSHDYISCEFNGKVIKDKLIQSDYQVYFQNKILKNFEQAVDLINIFLSNREEYAKDFYVNQIKLLRNMITIEEKNIHDIEDIYIPSLKQELTEIERNKSSLLKEKITKEEKDIIERLDNRYERIIDEIKSINDVETRKEIKDFRTMSLFQKRENIKYLKSEVNLFIDLYNQENVLFEKF